MVQITLPGGDRRAFLRAFWIILSAGFGLGVGVVAWRAGARQAGVSGLIAAAALCGLAWWQEPVAARLYRAWNRRLARRVGLLGQRWVMRICFLIIRVAALRSGSRLKIAPARASRTGWSARSSLPGAGYEALFFTDRSADALGPWAGRYIRWALDSGNGWALSLLPFLAILRWLDPGEEKAFAANIYTLF